MLAVLKAGGAFVPLDPSHPIARLESLVKEVEARVIICSPSHSSRLSSAAEHVLCVDAEHMDQMAAENTASKDYTFNTSTVSTNAAYVLFTSGSTGKPKVRICLVKHENGLLITLGHRDRTSSFLLRSSNPWSGDVDRVRFSSPSIRCSHF